MMRYTQLKCAVPNTLRCRAGYKFKDRVFVLVKLEVKLAIDIIL